MPAAFLLFASLIAVAPALTIVGGPLVDGVMLATVATAVGIAAAVLNQDDLGRITHVLRPIAPLMLAPGIWILLQISPLPGRWLANPVWTAAAAALGRPVGGLISVDVGATLLAFARYCELVGIAILGVALALDRRRAKGILVLSTTVAAVIAAQVILAALGHGYALGFERPVGRTEALNVAVLGVITAGATGLLAVQGYQSNRSLNRTSAWLLAATSIAAFAICLSAIMAESASIAIFAALFGVGTLAAVAIARRLRLSRWGQMGIAAIALVAVFGIFVKGPAPRELDASSMSAGGSQPSIAIAARMLSDAAWTGSGAGTFGALSPIYRDAGAAASGPVTAPTAVAAIAIELGPAAVWVLTIAALFAALRLFDGALRRGRDYFYPAAGTACLLVIVILSFGNSGMLGRAPAALAGVICGVALAQRRGRLDATVPHSAGNTTVISRWHAWPRVALMSFCAVCAMQAVWIVVPELQHHRTIHMPVDAQAASMARFERDSVGRAAALAVVRGDLWAESAFTYSILLWTDATKPTEPGGGPEQIRAMTNLERALKYSPHRGDVWLMLAALSQRYAWSGADPASLLKMSFYTAPNELNLVPQRVVLAARIGGIEDAEIQDLIKRDIRLLLTRAADPNSVLVAAYRNASAKNRLLLERFVAEIDPARASSTRPALN